MTSEQAADAHQTSYTSQSDSAAALRSWPNLSPLQRRRFSPGRGSSPGMESQLLGGSASPAREAQHTRQHRAGTHGRGPTADRCSDTTGRDQTLQRVFHCKQLAVKKKSIWPFAFIHSGPAPLGRTRCDPLHSRTFPVIRWRVCGHEKSPISPFCQCAFPMMASNKRDKIQFASIEKQIQHLIRAENGSPAARSSLKDTYIPF